MTRHERWTVRLTKTAEEDFQGIAAWTARHFGKAQARIYAETLTAAITALTSGPDVPGVRARDDIRKGVRVLHVARRGRKGRHFLLFRVGEDAIGRRIEVLRILHDAIDLPRHLP
ncbi:type II toxin-antitoxin system RelE/ParE family toxin [Modicisalibacter ilicicola]|uniref:type II toxin-antitoxin system RelE/ParE family toxin n=1 Tax=Modicisalibacter ilicicola TaxID=480814 RepID=UPI0009328544